MTPKQSNLKAALWMAGSIASFLAMSIAGREVMASLNVFQVMEMRSVIGFVMLLPLVALSGGVAAMRTRRPLQHIGRNAIHYVGQLAWLYALTLIPLAELISIEFTTPIWTALFAVSFLGERLTPRRVLAIAFGLIGIVIILRPGLDMAEPGHFIVLFAAFSFGISVVMVKSLTRTEGVVRIIFWMLVIQSAIGLYPAILYWQNPPMALWLWIVIIAFTGTFSHLCLARALSYADATVVSPMDFLRLPLSALIGWMLYSEGLDLFTVGGAVLILAANFLNIQRKSADPSAIPLAQ